MRRLIILVFCFATVYCESKCKLGEQIQKIGCYRDIPRMRILKHKKVDWNNFHSWFDRMTCECIQEARSHGFDFIQISDFGRCSAGRHFDALQKHIKSAIACFNYIDWNMCDDSSNRHCVGSEGTGYVYKITGKGPNRDGGYSHWSGWSVCSVTCGGAGVQERGRECTNPIPEGHGKDCSRLGPPKETRSCNPRKACPGAFLTEVSFTSRNYREYKIGEGRHHGSWIITKSRQDFRLVGALNGRENAVSIQTLDGQRYLRHAGWYAYFHKNDGSALFKNDASFYLRKNRFFHDGTVALESCNYPGHFLRHAYYRMQLRRPDGSLLYRNDASFIMATTEDKYTGVANLISRNYHGHSIGSNSRYEGFIVPGRHKFRMIPGLNGREGTVTFKLLHQNRYLRHRYGLVHFDHNDGSQLFKDDASFYIRENKFFNGYAAFEASNYPNAYLRHQNYRIKLHYPDHSLLYKNDASFMIARVSS